MSDIERALKKGADPVKLATSAHEVGHGLVELSTGGHVNYVKLNYAFLGMAFAGGECDWEWDPDNWTKGRAESRLLALMAGHAAETWFRSTYLGMDWRKAYRSCKDDAYGDYQVFKQLRRRFGISMSEDKAFDRTLGILEGQQRRWERLSVRLCSSGRISGGAL